MGVTKLVVQQGPVYVYRCTSHGGGPIAVDEKRLGLLVPPKGCVIPLELAMTWYGEGCLGCLVLRQPHLPGMVRKIQAFMNLIGSGWSFLFRAQKSSMMRYPAGCWQQNRGELNIESAFLTRSCLFHKSDASSISGRCAWGI